MRNSILWILIKCTIYILIVYYLWYVGFFMFLFVWLPHIIVYVYGLFIEYGVIPVLKYYKWQWYTIGILSIIALYLFLTLVWRAKRKDFKIGGEFEGKVVWMRGIRSGWAYACWDLYNYCMHKMNKKKEKVSLTQDLSKCTEISPGTWPDPFAIPMGLRSDSHYVIYIRRSFLQIIPERWIISRNVVIKHGIYHLSLPNMDVKRIPRPDHPGRYDFHLTTGRVKSLGIEPALITKKNRRMLKRSNQYTEIAILSDSETQKKDFQHGSRIVPYITEREGDYD